MQVDLRELVKDTEQEARVVQSFKLVCEQKLVEEHIAHIGRKLGDVVDQIFVDVFRILPLQGCEGEPGQIVELDVLSDHA